MIGRALWWLVARLVGPGVSEAMLDEVEAVIREES